MLNLDREKEVFTKYVNNYDMNQNKIALKYYHSLRVMDFCKKIAQSLNMSESDINICESIGLLHDIGRFEQVKRYDTFSDRESVDHAHLGVQILKDKNFINDFTTDEEVQNLIMTAIENHNKPSIEKGLDERTNTFCKIIRDADKLDIFDIFICNDLRIEKTDSYISPAIYDALINTRYCNDKDVKTKLDYYLRQIGLFFDLNFQYSIEHIKEKRIAENLIDDIIEKNPQEKEKLENIKEVLLSFLNTKRKQ